MRPVSKKMLRSKQPKKAEADRKTLEEAEADRRAAALTPAQVEEANRILAMVTARSKGGGKRAKCMAKEAADHKEKEEADRKTLEEADRRAEEADRKAKKEAERTDLDEAADCFAACRAKEAVDRKAHEAAAHVLQQRAMHLLAVHMTKEEADALGHKAYNAYQVAYDNYCAEALGRTLYTAYQVSYDNYCARHGATIWDEVDTDIAEEAQRRTREERREAEESGLSVIALRKEKWAKRKAKEELKAIEAEWVEAEWVAIAAEAIAELKAKEGGWIYPLPYI